MRLSITQKLARDREGMLSIEDCTLTLNSGEMFEKDTSLDG